MRVWILVFTIVALLASMKFWGNSQTESDVAAEQSLTQPSKKSSDEKSDLGLESVTPASEFSKTQAELKIPSISDSASTRANSALDEKASINTSPAAADKRLQSVESALSEYENEDPNFEEKSISDQALLDQFREGKAPPPPDWDDGDDDYSVPPNDEMTDAFAEDESLINDRAREDRNRDEANRDAEKLDPPGYAR